MTAISANRKLYLRARRIVRECIAQCGSTIDTLRPDRDDEIAGMQTRSVTR